MINKPTLRALNAAGEADEAAAAFDVVSAIDCFGRRQDAYDRMIAATLAGDEVGYQRAKAEFWAEDVAA